MEVGDVLEEVETGRSSPEEEQEEDTEEKPLFEVPPLPEIPNRRGQLVMPRHLASDMSILFFWLQAVLSYYSSHQR